MLSRGFTGQARKQDPPRLTWAAVGMGAFPIICLLIIEACAILLWSR
jgi:hypothetical protein